MMTHAKHFFMKFHQHSFLKNTRINFFTSQSSVQLTYKQMDYAEWQNNNVKAHTIKFSIPSTN